ncbi:transcriptional regulator domain-containing protein [Rhizorhabdus sp. FW153]|uniref:transcriptional regulator domain-containing protein n=1 Tax=Rhizorhabdus sp. FW153 TaxID=3400216 RepID=UPI003CF8C4D1
MKDWRDTETYARLAGIDRAGMMWEWLRRDSGYVSWYVRASVATRGTGALRWGLHFRREPGTPRPRCQDHLACRTRSRNPDSNRRTRIGLGPRCDRTRPTRVLAHDNYRR